MARCPPRVSAQMSVSPAELEELEEVEGWVNLMAELEVRVLPRVFRRRRRNRSARAPRLPPAGLPAAAYGTCNAPAQP